VAGAICIAELCVKTCSDGGTVPEDCNFFPDCGPDPSGNECKCWETDEGPVCVEHMTCDELFTTCNTNADCPFYPLQVCTQTCPCGPEKLCVPRCQAGVETSATTPALGATGEGANQEMIKSKGTAASRRMAGQTITGA
jgi:hypothetical protein